MIEASKKTLSFFGRHPFVVFLIGALALSVAAIIVISNDSQESAPPPKISDTAPEQNPPAYGGDIFKSKQGQKILKKNKGRASVSYDNNPEKKAEEAERIESRPALQLLPHYESGIAIDIANITPDGTPVVEVVRPEITSEDIAQQIWEGFVERSGDSEDNYVVIHREG